MKKSFFSGDENFQRFCSDVCKFPLLTRESEIEAAKSKNYDLLVNSNLRFVISIAHRRVQPNLELVDLIQVGCLGLIKAANKYNPDYEEVRFSSYAAFWITNEINDYIRKKSHRSRSDYDLQVKVKSYILNYENENGFVPPLEYIAEDLEIAIEKVQQVLCRSEVSLDTPIFEDEDCLTIADTIGCEPEVDVTEDVSGRTSKIENILLRTLSEKEIEFVHYKYGYFNGGFTMNISNVAKNMGISRQWADKLDKRVKVKLSANAVLRQSVA